MSNREDELQLTEKASAVEGPERAILIKEGPVPRKRASSSSSSSGLVPASISASSFFPELKLIKIMLLGMPEYKQRVMDMTTVPSHMNTLGISSVTGDYDNTKFQIWNTAYLTVKIASINHLRNAQALLFVPDTAETLLSLYEQSKEADCPMFWMEVELPGDSSRGVSQKSALNEMAASLPGLVKLSEISSFEDLFLRIKENIVERQAVNTNRAQNKPR